jgi:hypothetical protein
METMQLKHLNLTTSDVAGLAGFFEQYFGFTRAVERGSGGFVLLRNADEFFLAVMRGKKDDAATYPRSFHVGFYLDGAEAVQAKHNELATAGLAPARSRRRATTVGALIFIVPPPAISSSRSPRRRCRKPPRLVKHWADPEAAPIGGLRRAVSAKSFFPGGILIELQHRTKNTS